MVSEQKLIAGCKDGRTEAWDELFERHYAATGRFLFQMSPVFTREDVEEMCQDVFLAVVRNLGNYQGNSTFQTWLFRIAINKARDFLIKQKAVKRGGGDQPLSLNAENPDTGLALNPPASTLSPDKELMNSERMILLRQTLDILGDPCRELIELRYFGDLSYQEIAAELEMNPKTVSSRLSKCLGKLEEAIQPILQREKMLRTSV